ncbi:isochorismatase family protein [Jeotgalibacillus soli]|uniref:Uncharacterized protein n=1 Tax=Jeotgalibacillus soli TaxID=889306 RepID=A0A0C2RQ98_9BACL|nr:isochorismatase family protein [Jeotgalibacillus soli]KIL43924.1 hypothetical protein KP78_37480 [Jeotgalibacillus soli]
MSFINKIDPASTALIVVDVQNDFCSEEGALGIQGADVGMVKTMMPNLTELISEARDHKYRLS